MMPILYLELGNKIPAKYPCYNNDNVYKNILEVTMAEIKFEVIEHIGVLSESSKGWKKEINLISWNGNEPKYDIREWAPNREKMGKGITLSGEEVQLLKKLLESI